jgi:Tfp pilus assembly protein PilN
MKQKNKQMVNINLASSDGQIKHQEERINWGWMVPLEMTLVIIIIGVLAFLYFDIKNLQEKIGASKAEYEIQASKLKTESSKNVFDFQNRMNEADLLLSSNVNSPEILKELEKTIIPEAFLKTFTFDSSKNEISVVYFARSFDQVARQISSLKSSAYFLNVSGGETKINDKGLIEFSVLAKTK